MTTTTIRNPYLFTTEWPWLAPGCAASLSHRWFEADRAVHIYGDFIIMPRRQNSTTQHGRQPPPSVACRAYYRGLEEGRPQPLPYAEFETSLQPGGVRLVVCLLESAPELTGLAEEATRDILGALPEGAHLSLGLASGSGLIQTWGCTWLGKW